MDIQADLRLRVSAARSYKSSSSSDDYFACSGCGAGAGVAGAGVGVTGADGVTGVAGVEDCGAIGVTGVAGVPGVAGADAGITGAVDPDALCSIVPLKMPRCECKIASDNVVARRMHAHQIVRRTSADVVPAPNTLSVNPPPNAAPTPCSDDFCISTSTIKNSATNTWITVSIPIKEFILSFRLCSSP